MAELKKVGLIGWPADHSISPAMHNAAFKDLGLDDWHYDLMPTPPNELKMRVQTLAERGYVGANVTVPHKQTIIPFLNSVAMSAKVANAVNTLLIEDGRITGHNTDVYGIRADLEANGIKLQGTKALILGAGGAAHAAVWSLLNAGADVTVVNRHSERAWELYRTVKRGMGTSPHFGVAVQELSALNRVAPTVDLIINCTSAGMYPVHTETSPWPASVPIPSSVIVYDMVYRPEVTKFMQQAQAAGAKVIGGLGMLVQQGAAAFQLWTGKEPSLDVMFRAAKEELARLPDSVE